MKYKIFQPQAIHELGQRSNQEDSLFPAISKATPADRLFLVCDGMGGHENGEVASQAICEVMSQFIRQHLSDDRRLTDDILQQALQAVYQRLDQLDKGGNRKMGSTMTLLCLHRGGCTVAYMGDSRIYHLRPATREVRFRSKDHSQVYDLFAIGELSYDEIKTAQDKNIITRAIMPGMENRSKIDIVHIADVKAGDYFYLCSDGMLEQMEDEDLISIVASKAANEQKRQMLIAATQNNKDNHSAYLIQIEEVVNEITDSHLQDDEQTSMSNELVFKRHIMQTVTPQNHNINEEVTIVPTYPTSIPPIYQPKQQLEQVNQPTKESKLKKYKWIPILLLALLLIALSYHSCSNIFKLFDKPQIEKKDDPTTNNPTLKQQENPHHPARAEESNSTPSTSTADKQDPLEVRFETIKNKIIAEFKNDSIYLKYEEEIQKANNDTKRKAEIMRQYKQPLESLKQQKNLDKLEAINKDYQDYKNLKGERNSKIDKAEKEGKSTDEIYNKYSKSLSELANKIDRKLNELEKSNK